MGINGGRLILFTGGTGFLGSFLSAQLLRDGYTISFLIRPKDGKEEKIRIIEQLEAVGVEKDLPFQVDAVAGDVTKPFCGISPTWIDEHIGNISGIWHLAGLVAFRGREKLFSLNVEGTKHVLELAQKLNAHLNYVSTAYVAGNLEEKEILEDELKKPPSFKNPYEESKYEAEKMVRDFTLAGKITSTIYRPSILIGDSKKGQAFSFTGYYIPLHFFNRLKRDLASRSILSKIPLFIPYVKGATLNLLPIDFAVQLISSIAKHPQSKNKTFHIVHPNAPPVKFVFEESLKQLGYERMTFIGLSRMKMKVVRFSLIALSYIAGKFGRRLRSELGSYIDYLIDEHTFSTKNVREFLGDLTLVSPIDAGLLERCIKYAIDKNFGR